LVLENVLIIWETPSGSCPANDPPSGKYCFLDPIAITPPLNAVIQAECASGTTTDIDLTVSGGSGDFSYLWNTGAVTEDLSGVPLGMYTGTVTDNIKVDGSGDA